MILIQIIIISLLVFAIHYTMLPGEIFGFMERVYEKWLRKLDKCGPKPNWKYKLLLKIEQPLFSCPVCMAFWHGTYLYWLIPWSRLWLPEHDWVHWLIIIIGSLGLNSIIVRIFKEDE